LLEGSFVDLRSAPSPAVRERGYTAFSSKLLSRTAGEGGPSPEDLVGEGSAAFQQIGSFSREAEWSDGVDDVLGIGATVG